ncbi:hypothetical protein ABPG77_004568, partial [Micractinium sp. CCAP 211/92]
MPQKLAFTVAACSGEDPDFPASELLVHSHDSKGWCTPRFSQYPQDLTLRLEAPARLAQIQLLSHEFKIAAKSSYSARELKSVALSGTPAHLLRLVFHRCHANAANIYGQARASLLSESWPYMQLAGQQPFLQPSVHRPHPQQYAQPPAASSSGSSAAAG